MITLKTIPTDFNEKDFLEQWRKESARGLLIAEATDVNTTNVHIVYRFKPELEKAEVLAQVNINGKELPFWSQGSAAQHATEKFFKTAIATLKANPNILSGEFSFIPVWEKGMSLLQSFTYNFETEQVTVNIDNE
jgi:hypothetical protein